MPRQVMCFCETDLVPDESPMLALRSLRLTVSLHNHDHRLRWPLQRSGAAADTPPSELPG